MHIDTNTIDRIVAGVLHQLAAGGESSRDATRSTLEEETYVITANVITANVILDGHRRGSRVIVAERAIVTPAAWDAAREAGVEIMRRDSGSAAHFKCAAKPESTSTAGPLMIVVQNTDAVERLWDELRSTWRRELLGCPDDAAALAMSALCRGEASTVLILAEQAHRAACLANRNERVKAVAVGDAGDVRNVRKQLRANVWCVDPTGRSWFELRNILTSITTEN